MSNLALDFLQEYMESQQSIYEAKQQKRREKFYGK